MRPAVDEVAESMNNDAEGYDNYEAGKTMTIFQANAIDVTCITNREQEINADA